MLGDLEGFQRIIAEENEWLAATQRRKLRDLADVHDEREARERAIEEEEDRDLGERVDRACSLLSDALGYVNEVKRTTHTPEAEALAEAIDIYLQVNC